MKLKTIAIIFNALIIVSFGFVFIMPALFLGWEYAGLFWGENWYLVLIFFAVLIALNLYFLGNWRLFHALEDENWPAAIEVLEARIARRPTVSTVRMLCHACVLTSRLDRIRALEGEIAERRPSLVPKVVMVLAIPHLLSGDGVAIVAYFERYRSTVDRAGAPWVEWARAFGLMLQERTEEARETLAQLAEGLKPGLLLGLSAYLLNAWTRGLDSEGERVEGYRKAIRARYDRKVWARHVERERSELHVLVLGTLLDDVERWLYEETVSEDIQ